MNGLPVLALDNPFFVDAQNPIADHPLNVGLVAWWLPLPNNQGGGTLFDLGGRYPGVLINGPTWEASPNGFAAVRYSASNQSANFGDIGALDGGTALTVSAWVYQANLQEYGIVLGKIANNNERWVLSPAGSFDAGSDDVLCVVANGANVVSYTTAGILSAGVWHHWCMVYDGAGATDADRLKFYFDAVPQSLTYSGTIPSSLPTTAASVIQGVDFGWLDGKVSDTRAYSRVLSAAEVAALYSQSLRGHPDTLNRVRMWEYFDLYESAAPPATQRFNPAWAAQAANLIGAGCVR